MEKINSYRIATKSERFVNFLLDTFFLNAIARFHILCFIEIFKLDEKEQLTIILTNIIWLILFFLYYYLSELYTSKTPAKYITHTKVVSINNDRPSHKSILVRTLSRFIPFDILSFLSTNLGWHDSLSETLVVEDIYPDE